MRSFLVAPALQKVQCALQKVQCGGPSDHLKVSLRQLAYASAWKHSDCQEPGFRCRCAVISH